MTRLIAGIALGFTFFPAFAPAFADAAPAVRDSCSALAKLTLPARAIGLPARGARVDNAVLVTAGATGNANGEYCAGTGAIFPVATSAPGIEFQVNLASGWNGKAVQIGGGGYDGVLVTGTGPAGLQPASVPTPLRQGYVTLGSDGGHKGAALFDGRFGLDDEALLNYGQQSTKKTRYAADYDGVVERGEDQAPHRCRLCRLRHRGAGWGQGRNRQQRGRLQRRVQYRHGKSDPRMPCRHRQ